MHSYSHPKWEGTLHYNSDLSGDVQVVIGDHNDRDYPVIEIPGFILLDFIAQFVANQQVAQLEQAEPDEVLGLPEGTYERLVD